MASLNALHSYRQVPTPTIAPSKPCNTCGHDHWGYTCNTLSDSEKLKLYKKITRSQINRMKVIQLTTKVAEAVIYDEEAMTIDFSAGNDFAIRSTLLPSFSGSHWRYMCLLL